MDSPGQFDRVAMNIGMYIRWFGLGMKKTNGESARYVCVLVHIVRFSVRSTVPAENRVVHN